MAQCGDGAIAASGRLLNLTTVAEVHMPILQPFESASRAAVLAGLLLIGGVSGCGDRAGGQAAASGSYFEEGQARVEVDPCALLTSAEISEQLARTYSPGQLGYRSPLGFEITPTEVEGGVSRRCEYKFQPRHTVSAGDGGWSSFEVMVIHAAFKKIVAEHDQLPVAGAPEIFRAARTMSYYITKGDFAAVLTYFPGNLEGDESDVDATRIALLRRIAERLP